MDLSIALNQWKRPEELIQVAEQREAENYALTSDELLMLKSRSFYGPIMLLDVAKGEKENTKRKEVRNMYNLLRELDTIEDYPTAENVGPIVDEKSNLMDMFTYLVGEVVKENGCGRINDIIKRPDLRTITKKLEERVKSKEEKVFVRHFGKGPVLQELCSFDTEIKQSIDYGVARMANGMKSFIKRGEMQTIEQLTGYCFYVAGSIGTFLKKLIKTKDNFDLNEEEGQKFGEFLQLVNITKNVREDYKEGRIFLPAEIRPREISHMYLMDNQGLDAVEAREKMFSRILSLIESDWSKVINYVSSIPNHLSGYKAFTLVPLITAREAIEVMRNAGPEEVFSGKEEAIKPKGGIIPIMNFAKEIVLLDEGKRTNVWLSNYETNPEKFSFISDRYNEWSKQWMR